MQNKDKYIESIVHGFQENRGHASCCCFNKNMIPELVSSFVKRFCDKNKNRTVLVVTNTFAERTELAKRLETDGLVFENEYKCRVLSYQYINTKYNSSRHDLTIVIGLNNDIQQIQWHYRHSTFALAIFTNPNVNEEVMDVICKNMPLIDTKDASTLMRKDDIYSPVKEVDVAVELSGDDAIKYKKYDEFVSTSMVIFKDLETVEKCKHGDKEAGVSAIEYRTRLAHENGWSEELDTSLPYMRQIDSLYNPNILYERACTFFNIARDRRNFTASNSSKLETILKLCEENKDKKILIVSKSGDYATTITKYINGKSELKCGDFHDCIPPMEMQDESGMLIVVKSGKNKGKTKMLGSQAISTMNMKKFNEDKLNVLSIKECSDPSLSVTVDTIIITSPACSNIVELKQRFENLKVNGETPTVYVIYCADTIEAEEVEKKRQKYGYVVNQ